ncbi:uncharacterized protein [Phaseolus vulgaris]|uniref:uncharacterized protein n=1 Tax=Phaseolus vulgaris TaxID=3885 RepID=UPI0035CB2FBC
MTLIVQVLFNGLVQVLFKGLPTTDLTNMTHGIILKPQPTCQICKKIGHTIEFFAGKGILSSVDDPLWYPDSGATHHITNNSSTYTSKNSYDGTDTVKMGNDTGYEKSYASGHS